MFEIGERVRSKRNGAVGRVTGYGAIQWPQDQNLNGDEEMRPVYLVQILPGSGCFGPLAPMPVNACIVMRADQVERSE